MQEFPLQLQHPSGRVMSLERDRVLTELAEPVAAAADARATTLSELGLVEETEPETFEAGATIPARPMQVLNRTDTRVWARTADATAFRATSIEPPETRSIRSVSPVYRLELQGRSELLAVLSDAMLIYFTPEDPNTVSEVLERYGLQEDTERSQYLGDLSYFRVQQPLEATAIELRQRLLREEPSLVRNVRFEIMPMFKPTAYDPNDALYADQWNVRQIVAGGAGQTAWNLDRGDPDVVVCILDEGCDLDHPDLNYASDGINLGTMMPDGSPTGDHGTACAGIATASINNATGVAGLAGECLILPVAFQNWTDVEVAAGIRYAAQNGARVISMSFGWDPWDHAIIDPAIQEAFDLNVVMCVATHNHDAAITYPATNPLVMACGASDQVDNRKSPTSPDGEGWGSNFGPAMSVVAPGVLIPTTDRTGNVGYTMDDYMTNFNGTSSATPHVAGLAALLLSRDKTLSGVEVRTILEQTADKVGAVPYAPTPGYPNGTWNQEMGYGRINAYKAVQSVPTMAVAGNWTLFYDWFCDGTYNSATMTVNTDGTWTNSEGDSGLWTQDAGLFTFTFDGLETTYAGNLASKSITGTSTTFTGLNGCFYMLQEGVPIAVAAERVAGQRDAAGNE